VLGPLVRQNDLAIPVADEHWLVEVLNNCAFAKGGRSWTHSDHIVAGDSHRQHSSRDKEMDTSQQFTRQDVGQAYYLNTNHEDCDGKDDDDAARQRDTVVTVGFGEN
jgi:hypothetical protein